jgi:beta-1,2-mannosidase
MGILWPRVYWRVVSIDLEERTLVRRFSHHVLLPLGFLWATSSLLAQSTQSWALGPFVRPVDAPIIEPNPKAVFTDPILGKAVHWEALHTFNPAAIVREGKVYVLYRAEDDSGAMVIGMHTSRLGLASSDDGVHFTTEPVPVFYPDVDSQKDREWPGGVEDPRLVESEDGTYVLTYTQWNRQATDIGIATSTDLIHWTKHGPALVGEKYQHFDYKSASIVTRLTGGRLIAARIQGKYWMYWGEVQVRLATSPDLIHWTPVEDSSGKAIVLLHNRPRHFDSAFPEVGPPSLLTDHGIVLIYNGKDAEKNGAPGIAASAYSDGQALFSADDPRKLLARTEKPFFKPEKSWEQSGQYAAGTTFAEGLVFFQDKWFMYYGCADSRVGVAVWDPKSARKP